MTEVSAQTPSGALPTAREEICGLDLGRDERGVVCGYADACFAHKYLCLGVRLGSRVEMVRRAPFGQTCYFKIDGRPLAVRKEEAACLLLHRLAERP